MPPPPGCQRLAYVRFSTRTFAQRPAMRAPQTSLAAVAALLLLIVFAAVPQHVEAQPGPTGAHAQLTRTPHLPLRLIFTNPCSTTDPPTCVRPASAQLRRGAARALVFIGGTDYRVHIARLLHIVS